MYVNIIRAICNTPTANILPSGKKLKALPLRSGTRCSCPISPLLHFYILTINYQKDKQESNHIYNHIKKNKIHRSNLIR